MRTLLAATLLLGLLLSGSTVASEPAGAGDFRIIVNAQNPVTSVDRRFLGEAFLKKVTRWDNGEVIRPVDRDDGPVRRAFSEQVIQRSMEAVKTYWQQRVFSGDNVPPPELDSDAEVVRYVMKYPGAVGYVAASSSVAGVKIIAVK